MKQLSTMAIKLSIFIIAAASIVSACTMNCGCCDTKKGQNTETAACCIFPAHSDSFIPLLSVTGESAHYPKDVCNSCNCNTLPVKESNAVSSGFITLKMHQTAVSVSNQSYISHNKYSVQSTIAPLNAHSVPLMPLRI